MHDDPSINIVTFEFLVKAHPGKVRKVIGARSVRDEDYVQSIYKDLRPQLDPNSVIKIKSEWEPSQRDKYFIEKTIKKAKLEYYWSRPTSDVEWAKAIEQATDHMKKVINQKINNESGR